MARKKKISIEKKIEKGVEDIEEWIIERRKFFIKLGFVVCFILLLLLISRFYLRVKGFG